MRWVQISVNWLTRNFACVERLAVTWQVDADFLRSVE